MRGILTRFFAVHCTLVILALSLTSGTTHAEDLNVGANIGNVPWEFQNAQGEFVGFEIDLVNEVGARLGKPVEIVNIPFNGLFSAVQSGRIDIAVSSITITEKRLASVAFAQAYYDSAQSLTSSLRSVTARKTSARPARPAASKSPASAARR